MKSDSQCIAAFVGGFEEFAEGLAHEGHLVGEADVGAHEHEAGPVGRVGEVLRVLHRLHGLAQRAAHSRSLNANENVVKTIGNKD